MAEKMVRARLDDQSRLALRMLVRSGMTESEAVRTSLVEAWVAVVLQAHGIAHWSTVLVAPLSASAQRSSFRPPVDVLGTLSADEMMTVEEEGKKVLGCS